MPGRGTQGAYGYGGDDQPETQAGRYQGQGEPELVDLRLPAAHDQQAGPHEDEAGYAHRPHTGPAKYVAPYHRSRPEWRR